MAALVSKANGQLFCGATIIDENYALSAAHCVNAPGRYAADIELLVGEHDYRNRTNYWRYLFSTTVLILNLIDLSIRNTICQEI